jgi:DNA replication regulator DPB11
MRVMYEDPDQRDEKKRLMNLLKNQAEDELPVPSGRTRRSTRMAGF